MKQLSVKLEQAEIYNPGYVENLLRENQDLQMDIIRLKETIATKKEAVVMVSSASTNSSPTLESLDMSVDSGYVKQCERIEREKDKLRDDLATMKEFVRNQSDELTRLSKLEVSLVKEIERLGK